MTTSSGTRGQSSSSGGDVQPASGSSGRIRVLHLLYTMAYGGVDTTVINWLRKIDRDRFEPYLVCFAVPGSKETPFVDVARLAGLEVCAKLPWSRTKPVLSAARHLRDFIREHRIDIVHSHNCYADVVACVAGMMTPVKLATTLYVWGDFGWRRNIIQWVNQWAIRRFDLISAHCQDAVEATIARGFAPERVQLLISGFESDRSVLSAEERRRLRRERGLTDREVVLINVARFYPEKAQDALLHSFRKIVDRHPEARLWLLGVGPLEAELRRLTSSLGLESQVSFLGFVADFARLLPLVDIQVHPSHNEGVPLAVCSGLAAGLPVVASDVGGLREVLRHDVTGILVPPGDWGAFTDAVIDLIEKPEKAGRLGSAALQFIENDYSLESATRALENAYVKVLGK